MWKCMFCDMLDEQLKNDKEKEKETIWDPTIDYNKCIWCLACFNFCKQRVYKLDENGKPFVVKPENCVPGCRGCEKVCPVWAISH